MNPCASGCLKPWRRTSFGVGNARHRLKLAVFPAGCSLPEWAHQLLGWIRCFCLDWTSRTGLDLSWENCCNVCQVSSHPWPTVFAWTRAWALHCNKLQVPHLSSIYCFLILCRRRIFWHRVQSYVVRLLQFRAGARLGSCYLLCLSMYGRQPFSPKVSSRRWAEAGCSSSFLTQGS